MKVASNVPIGAGKKGVRLTMNDGRAYLLTEKDAKNLGATLLAACGILVDVDAAPDLSELFAKGKPEDIARRLEKILDDGAVEWDDPEVQALYKGVNFR